MKTLTNREHARLIALSRRLDEALTRLDVPKPATNSGLRSALGLDASRKIFRKKILQALLRKKK